MRNRLVNIPSFRGRVRCQRYPHSARHPNAAPKQWAYNCSGCANEPNGIRYRMSDHFINLTCANCGGKLEVYDDMERFACGYCGSEMLVQRRGGTVILKAITEAIQKVQIGRASCRERV